MMYDSNNIFAKILRSEIPAATIFENEFLVAFNDISPAAKIHVIAIPRGEYTSYSDFLSKASEKEIIGFFSSINELAKKLNVMESGFRLITNKGKDANQTVHHFHVHLLAGEQLKGF